MGTRTAPKRNADNSPEIARLEAAVDALRRSPGELRDAGGLAAAAGVGGARLRELIRDQYHSTPSRLIAETRAAAARLLLLATRRPTDKIAAEVGFADPAACDRALRRHAGLDAAGLRRLRGARGFEATLPHHFDGARALGHVGRDVESSSERVDGLRAAVGMRVGGAPAVLALDLRGGRLRGRLTARRKLPAGAAAEGLEVARRLLGLATDPAPFERWVARRPTLAALVDGRRGLRIQLARDPFDCLLWAIVGQQVNLRFAYTLRRAVFALAGEPAGDGLLAPPTPQEVAALDAADLTRRQFSRSKAEYLLAAARAVAAGELPLRAMAAWTAPRVEAALLARRGLGPWSTHYVMMRGFGLADCAPVGDSGLSRGLVRFYGLPAPPTGAEVLRLLEPFRPFRSFATTHLWKSLETEP
jgi:3-methyladenine DNA glycosylase/8-oxoguanine DNA glycosylase/AraC-like DNA-binding protein